MKKHFIIILVLACAMGSYQGAIAQKLSSYNSKWQAQVSKEKEEDLINEMQLDEKSQFLFLISNDEKKIYVDLIVADRAGIQKIMRYGLTTWINPEGKHKKALGIAFPVTSEGKSEPNFMRDKNGGGDRKEMRMAIMAAKNQEMDLIGFGEKGEPKVIDPRNDANFRGKAEMMEGGKLYISLELPMDQLKIAYPGEPFSLGFETGYMDVTGSGMPSGGGGQQPGGGGMYGGGGPGGGGPPMGGSQGSMGGSADQQERPDISQLASPSRLWIKQVILSPKQ